MDIEILKILPWRKMIKNTEKTAIVFSVIKWSTWAFSHGSLTTCNMIWNETYFFIIKYQGQSRNFLLTKTGTRPRSRIAGSTREPNTSARKCQPIRSLPHSFRTSFKGYRRYIIFACEFSIFTSPILSHLRGGSSNFIATILSSRAERVVQQKGSSFIFPSKIQDTFSFRYSTVVAWIVQPYKVSVSYRWLQITTLCNEPFSVLFLAALCGEAQWLLKTNVALNKSYTQQTTNWIKVKPEI